MVSPILDEVLYPKELHNLFVRYVNMVFQQEISVLGKENNFIL